MAIKFTGIGHVAIRCKDYEIELKFYTETLQLEKILDIYDDNNEKWITYLRIKKGQYLELFNNTRQHLQNAYVGDNRQCNRSPFNVGFEIRNINDMFENKNGNICNILINDPEANEWEFSGAYM